MFRKTFVLALAMTLSAVAAIAQTDTDKPSIPTAPRIMTFDFTTGGGYLGVQTKDVNSENFSSLGLSSVRGVAVEKVMEGSPAEKAGLQAGDVIVRVNGEEITSAKKLTRLIGEIAPDHTASMTVVRGGSEREVVATIGRRDPRNLISGNFPSALFEGKTTPFTFKTPDFPDLGELPKMDNFPDGNNVFVWRSGGSAQIGIGVSALTKQLADHFGVEKGVLVNEVRSDSPAAKAGLQAGDIIVETDGKTISNEIDLIKAVNSKKEGGVSVTFVRGVARQTVNVTPVRTERNMQDLLEKFRSPSSKEGEN